MTGRTMSDKGVGNLSIIALVSVVALVVAGVAYYATLPSEPGDDDEPGEENALFEDIKIDFIIPFGPGNPFWYIVQNGAEEANEITGCDLRFIYTGAEVADYRSQVERSIGEGVDGIAFPCHYEDAVSDLIGEAREQGIHVMAANVGPSRVGSDYVEGYVGADLVRQGRLLGEYIKDHVNLESGDKVLYGAMFPGLKYSVDRGDGLKSVFEPLGIEWEMIETTAEAPEVISRLNAWYSGNPLPKVMVYDGAFGFTAEEIFETQGIEPSEVYVAGFDLNEGIVGALKNKWVDVTIGQQPYVQGFATVVNLCIMAKYDLHGWNLLTGGLIMTAEDITPKLEELVEQGYR